MTLSVFASCDNDEYYDELKDIANTSKTEEEGSVIKIEKYMSQENISSNLQAGDCYGDYFFQFENNNARVLISNLKTKRFLGMVTLSSNSKNHCNNVSFSRIFYDTDDEFPLLYVSGSPSGTYNHVQVYRIQKMDNTFTISKVQEIVLPKSNSDNNLYWTGAVMDNENGFMYVYANNQGAQIAKFNIPDIMQKEIALTDEDILEQFTVATFRHQQGAVIHNGMMYVMDGVPQWGDTNYLRIIDLVNKDNYKTINITELGFGNVEFESCSYYEDYFISASNSNRGIFSIHII